jgi:hypothetical protein
MTHPEFRSETSFESGETEQGRWQTRHHRQQTPQGSQESYARAQSSGNPNHYEVITEIGSQDDVVFQVSPDGSVRLIQRSKHSTHSYSSARSE